jgi:hypothetical protein
MNKSSSNPQQRQVDLLPAEITEHFSPPSDRSGLVAWLKLQSLRHADLAERRPWNAEFHRGMAASAIECAAHYEKQVRK